VITIPEPLRPVLGALAARGRPRLVGGCVRDALLGRPAGDIDIEVGGLSFGDIVTLLKPFGATDVVGRSFGTVKLRLAGVLYDISLPRRESKTGAGHRGFRVDPDPTLSDRDSASRRDFTINAMAWDPVGQKLIDEFNGQQDLRAGVIRHVSSAFAEDPLRVLRAMQLSARLDFGLAAETARLAQSMATSFNELPSERRWGEWDKWATLSIKPSRGIDVLVQTGWIEHFPEIKALMGVPQEPKWHPEGDVFIHTKHCLDALALDPDWLGASTDRRRILMLGVLSHDLGKPATTQRVQKDGQWRWTSPLHAKAGLSPTASLLTRIGAPHRLAPVIAPLVQFHLAHHDSGKTLPTDSQIRRLARKIAPATLADLVILMRADANGRPPRHDPETIDRLNYLTERATELSIADSAPRPLIQGRDLVARGLPPGPAFAPILAAAYEAQLAGEFTDPTESAVWLDSHLKRPSL
jgi:tRNA nucleotidyltransferase (CCA-adding enzyme)